MCIRLSLAPPAPTAAQIAAAQWDLIRALEFAVTAGEQQPNVWYAAYQLCHPADAQTPSPQHWVAAFARVLRETLLECQAAAAECDRLRAELAVLQQVVAAFRADPLREQLPVLIQERDQWRAQTIAAASRVHTLELALRQEQAAHQADLDRLQQQVADLNRVVVSQQEQINGQTA